MATEDNCIKAVRIWQEATIEISGEVIHTKLMKKKRTKLRKRKHHPILKRFKEFRLHHRIIFYLMGATGVIFFWRGAWLLIDQTPIFNDPFTSLSLGLGLSVVGGLFFELV